MIKTLLRELSPPILWKTARYVARKLNGRHPAPPPPKPAPRPRNLKGQERPPSYYDQTFEQLDKWRFHYTSSHYYFLWTVLADRIKRAGVQAVLDIGCGPGQVALLLRDRGLKDYCGIDFSTKRIEWAAQICPEFKFVTGDFFKTDLFQSYPYDGVVCSEVLEHIENDFQLVRLIRKGVRFFGTVPNFTDPAHVRFFKSEIEVYDRYHELFDDLQVDSFLQNKEGLTYFLLEGVTR